MPAFPTDNEFSQVNVVTVPVDPARVQMSDQIKKGDAGYFPSVGMDMSCMTMREAEIMFCIGTPPAEGYPPVQTSLNGWFGTTHMPIEEARSLLISVIGTATDEAFEKVECLTACHIAKSLTVMGVSDVATDFVDKAGKIIHDTVVATCRVQGTITFPVIGENAVVGQRVYARVPTRTRTNKYGKELEIFDGVPGKVVMEFETRDRLTVSETFVRQMELFMKDPYTYALLFKADVDKLCRSVMLSIEWLNQVTLGQGIRFAGACIDMATLSLNPLHSQNNRPAQNDVPGTIAEATRTSTNHFTQHRTNIPDFLPLAAAHLSVYYKSANGVQSAITVPNPETDRLDTEIELDEYATGAYLSSDWEAVTAAALGVITPSRGADGTRMGGLVFECFKNPFIREAWLHARTLMLNRMMGLAMKEDSTYMDARALPYAHVLAGGDYFENEATYLDGTTRKPRLVTEAGRWLYFAAQAQYIRLCAQKSVDDAEQANYLGTVITGGIPGRTATMSIVPGKSY